jgi:hypothetical protein
VHPELNPYSPGSGTRPPVLVGRQRDIDAFDLIVARTRKHEPNRGVILHGLRGVGKTVLLNRFRDQAETASWFIVEVEGMHGEANASSVRVKLARELFRGVSKLRRRVGLTPEVETALATVTAFCHSAGGTSVDLGVPAAQERANSGDLAVDFEEVVEDLSHALRETSSAFGLFVDELQDLDDDLLTILLGVQHRAGQRGWPFYIIGAGLPVLPGRLARVRSYAERLFDYRHIGQLADAESREALVVPATDRGAKFEQPAVDALLRAADGYPYFLQTFGRATWDAAVTKTITLEDANAGLEHGRQTLDDGFYPSRWSAATPVERTYLLAISRLSQEQVRTRDVADELGVPLGKLSTVRQQLIDKGILFASERGHVAFTVPGMLGFIRRKYES